MMDPPLSVWYHGRCMVKRKQSPWSDISGASYHAANPRFVLRPVFADSPVPSSPTVRVPITLLQPTYY